MKTTITPAERLQLVGLLTLADGHNRAIKDIERATAELLGFAPGDESTDRKYGHVPDAVYGERAPDELLRLLGISVEEGR